MKPDCRFYGVVFFWVFPALYANYTDLAKKMHGSIPVFRRRPNLPHDNSGLWGSDCSPVAVDNLFPPTPTDSVRGLSDEGIRLAKVGAVTARATNNRTGAAGAEALIFFFVKAQFSAVGCSPAPQKRVAGLSEWLREKLISVTSRAETSWQDLLDATDLPYFLTHLRGETHSSAVSYCMIISAVLLYICQ